MKFRPKFFWKRSFFNQNQQPLKGVEPFERILRALFISQCPYKFSSFLDVRNASNRFWLFSRDFLLFRFFFPGSACFSSLASPRNLPSWVKYHGKFESFGKFIAVERVSFTCNLLVQNIEAIWNWHVNLRKNYSKPPRFDETSSVEKFEQLFSKKNHEKWSPRLKPPRNLRIFENSFKRSPTELNPSRENTWITPTLLENVPY